MQAVSSRASHDRMSLFLEWTGAAPPHDFPDPYYGEPEEFTRSVALAERGVEGLIKRLRVG
ncbi:MAG TPA: hypothetical protein VL997_15540, partial [Dyella sp.]|nr:hypothetical protein [Dyella sp.]